MQYVQRNGQGQKAQKMNYTNSQVKAIIDEYIHDKRARTVLTLRLCDHFTYEEIATEVDRSVRQVGYIIAKYTPVIAQHLSQNCI